MKHCVITASVLACLLLALGACSTSNRKASGTIPSDGFPAPDKEFVWNIAAQALREQGYTPDSSCSSQRTWTIVTHWRMELQPFSGHGHRERATVTIHDVCGRPDYYFTQTQVARQINNNIKTPDLAYCAQWGAEERQPTVENLINKRIEMYFLPGGVSCQFQQLHGMQRQDSRRVNRPSAAPPPKPACEENPLAPGGLRSP